MNVVDVGDREIRLRAQAKEHRVAVVAMALERNARAGYFAQARAHCRGTRCREGRAALRSPVVRVALPARFRRHTGSLSSDARRAKVGTRLLECRGKPRIFCDPRMRFRR